MNFKLIFLVLASLSALSCSLNIGEEPREPAKLRTEQITCVRDIDAKIDSYFAGKLSADEINEFVNCVAGALSNFERYTKGSHQKYYLTEEIKKSVQNVIYPDRPIDGSLAESFAAIKQLVAGGTKTIVTRREISKLIEFLNLLKVIAIELNPHIQRLKVVEGRSLTSLEIEKSSKILALGLQRISRQFELAGDFDFETLKLFSKGFKGLKSNAEGGAESPLIDVIIAFKNVVIGREELDTFIAKEEWEPLITEGVFWYEVWLKYNYRMKPNEVLHGQGLVELIDLVDNSIKHLRTAVNSHELVGAIEFERLDALVDALEKKGALTNKYRPESIKSGLRVAIQNLFSDPTIPYDLRQYSGIDRKVLATIEKEFFNWAEVQKFFDGQFKTSSETGMGGIDIPMFLEPGPSAFNLRPNQIFGSFASSHFQLFSLRDLLLNLTPLHLPGDPRVIIAKPEYRNRIGVTNNFYQLSLVNIIHLFCKLIVSGYSEDAYRAQKSVGLTEEELQRFADDIQLIGEDLHIIPPDVKNAGRNIFLEANMFTYVGNGVLSQVGKGVGDRLLTTREGVEEISYLYSSVNITRNLYDQLFEKCYSGPEDVFGRKMVYSSCFWQNFNKLIIDNFSNTPGMRDTFVKLSGDTKKYKDELEEAQKLFKDMIFMGSGDGKWVSYINIGKLTMIVHYVETLLTRFDTDQDDIIDTNEGRAAFPHFKGLIDMLARNRCTELDDDELEMVFMYILENAKIPGGGLGVVWNDFWGWDVSVDRLQALRIFKAIVSSSEMSGETQACPSENVEEVEKFREDVEKIKSIKNKEKINL